MLKLFFCFIIPACPVREIILVDTLNLILIHSISVVCFHISFTVSHSCKAGQSSSGGMIMLNDGVFVVNLSGYKFDTATFI